jgi:thymidine kinase
MGTKGRLELIPGCMFSGKTTELIRRLRGAAHQGKRVVAIKPRRDTRYGREQVVTHAGEALPALEATCAADVERMAGDADVVGVDEAHFYDPVLVDVCRALVGRGRRVIVAGVDTDHFGDPFPVFPPLTAVADVVDRRTARCARCGGVAEYSQRLVDSNEPIVVGGSESYEPRCRFCFRCPSSRSD